MAAMRLLLVAALVALAAAQQFPVPDLSGDSCSVYATVCLVRAVRVGPISHALQQKGETDCNTRAYANRRCATGLHCLLDTTARNTTTNEFVGTCVTSALLVRDCRLLVALDPRILGSTSPLQSSQEMPCTRLPFPLSCMFIPC